MDYVEIAVPFFLLALLLELAYGKLINKNTYKLNDTISSLFMGSLRGTSGILKIGFSGYVYYQIETHFALWRMDSNLWITWIFAFVAYDFFTIGFIDSVMRDKYFGHRMWPIIKARNITFLQL